MILAAACTPQAIGSPTSAPSESVQASLEATVRHYYRIFNEVRATGNARLIDGVTDPEGVDRLNVREFAAEQASHQRLSVVTKDSFSFWKFTITGETARVEFDHQVSGYDIDSETRQPVESEVTLRPQHIMMELRRHGSTWLVFNRQVT